jgi:hypothetical protein
MRTNPDGKTCSRKRRVNSTASKAMVLFGLSSAETPSEPKVVPVTFRNVRSWAFTRNALKLAPDSTDANFHLGMALIMRGEVTPEAMRA